MRRSQPINPYLRLSAPAATAAFFCVAVSITALAEEKDFVVPSASVRYLESPFSLHDADDQGLPAYLRLPSKPPLFYPQAVDLFSWIDSTHKDLPSLQELIEQPDLADLIFPKRSPEETNFESSSLFDSFPANASEPDQDPPKDAVDLFVARISQEALGQGDENALKEYMRSHPLSAEDIEKGIAYFESLRKGNEVAPPPSAPSPSAPLLPVDPIGTTSSPVAPPAIARPVEMPFPPSIKREPPVAPDLASEASDPTKATLRMAAKVPMPDGSQRPAFASQFFLTTRQLEDLLTEAIPYPSAANDVRQLIRLWAESEKRAGSKGVKLALDVKSVLIKAQVSKFDTDLKGEAQVAGLKPDDYYLIGIDKDDLTGIVTIWSKPIAIGHGENRVELSLQDIVWNK